MKSIGVIPSRYASTRFPGKPLAKIKGKTLIERVWLRANKSRQLDGLVIATDNKKIKNSAEAFGAKVVMTSPGCKSGTDRLAETARKEGRDFGIYINIQGDEPLISPALIDNLVLELKKNPGLNVVTAVFPLKKQQEIADPNVVKAVLDKDNFALYFSRSTVPYNRKKTKVKYFKHLGIYGFKKGFLLKFSKMPQGPLEKAEQLEQLRILENGHKIKAVVSKYDSCGVDVPGDIKKVERMIR